MKIFRLVLAIVFGACVAAAAVVFFGPLLEKRAEDSRELATLRAENDAIERRTAELRRRQNEFETNPEYVELTARKEGRVKGNETVFDFGGPAGETPPRP